MSASSSPAVGDLTPDGALSSRRTLIRRAALVGAAVWTAPVLIDSVTSPAAAASCTTRTLDWNTIAAGTGGTTTCTGRRGAAPCTTTAYSPPAVGGVTLNFSTVANNSTTQLLTAAANAGEGNLTVRASPNGGLTTRALQLQMLPDSTTVGQTMTITFSQSVTNVSLTLFDIDNSVGGWGDRIVFSPVPATVVTTDSSWTPTSSTVTGAGTGANPLRNTSTNTNFADTSSLGNVTLTFSGPLTTVTMNYTNAVNTGGSNMRIGISNVSFCA